MRVLVQMAEFGCKGPLWCKARCDGATVRRCEARVLGSFMHQTACPAPCELVGREGCLSRVTSSS